ncbi:DedA family protein [Sphingomonas crocodyli]|uniref:DedA family protein n=1 Tax=Sphingomonas crocodyli TaxID=1979270 RepID=A0A437LYJ1_9SPHN|nr:DedA family protein [Sphingomonas crocodyli]RVT90498.1 DedA family protein [Sphingomonas crocodyli]
MADFVGATIDLLRAHADWAGPIAGLLCLVESLALVGMFVPAIAIMLMVGGLIGLGVLPFWSIFFWSIVGSVAGDAISYWLGQLVGRSAFRRWPLNRERAAMARARIFFRHYGFWAIILGRFFGPIRATIPIVAGAMSMSARAFQAANLISALLWVSLMLAPGILSSGGQRDVDDRAIAELMVMVGGVAIVGMAIPAVVGFTALRQRRRRKRERAAR